MAELARLTALVSGEVQGVGFRYWVRRTAEPLDLAGSATNLSDGRVEVVVEGPRSACEDLLRQLLGDATPGAVTGVSEAWEPSRGESAGFRLR